MLPSMWFMSIIALLVVDVRTGALQQKECAMIHIGLVSKSYRGQMAIAPDVIPRLTISWIMSNPRYDAALHRCYQCAPNATAACHATVECPGDRPLCATSAVAPNFLSSLHCATATKTPCSLTRTSGIYTLVCVCAGDLCNSEFTKELQNQLLEFSEGNVTDNNSSDYTETFFKSYSLANVTEDQLYKTITITLPKPTELPRQNASHSMTLSTAVHTRTTMPHSVEASLPHAEAFKHEPTALSEDDEDASEGSGSYEETRNQRQPASAPAAPSSYLPANENKAPPLSVTFLITTPIFMYFVA